MRRFVCPACKRVTETLGREAWCPGPIGGKAHVKPVQMKRARDAS